MAQTALDVCNLAIDRIAGERIEEIGEETPLGVACQNSYDQTTADLLSRHRWVFAKRIVQLARRAVTPDGCPRPYAFDRPADLVGAIHAFREAASDTAANVDTLQTADYVAAGVAELWAECTVMVPVPLWPAWFLELHKTVLASELALAVQNERLHDKLQMLAFGDVSGLDGGLLLAAKIADGRNAPQRQLYYDSDGPLIEVRNTGVPFTWDGSTVRWG